MKQQLESSASHAHSHLYRKLVLSCAACLGLMTMMVVSRRGFFDTLETRPRGTLSRKRSGRSLPRGRWSGSSKSASSKNRYEGHGERRAWVLTNIPPFIEGGKVPWKVCLLVCIPDSCFRVKLGILTGSICLCSSLVLRCGDFTFSQEAAENILKGAMMREADQRFWRSRAKRQAPIVRAWRWG